MPSAPLPLDPLATSSLGPISSNGLEKSTPAERVAAIAGQQHGVVSRAQLIEVGLSSSTIAFWARSGHLHPLHRGVYSVGSRALGDEGRWLAAVLACGESAALASISAAELLHLSRSAPSSPIHVAVLGRSKRRPRGIRVHRPRALEPRDVVMHRSVPVTSPTRTLFDVASLASPDFLRVMFERAEYQESLDRSRLHELLEGATGRRGIGNLRALLGFEPIPLSRTRSVLERLVLSVCRTHDLPVPGVNVPLLDYEVDFFWRAARLVVEADGGQHVGAQRDRDNERDAVLMRAGILVRRYSWEALQNREGVGNEIRSILVERLQAVAGPDLLHRVGEIDPGG